MKKNKKNKKMRQHEFTEKYGFRNFIRLIWISMQDHLVILVPPGYRQL